MSFLPEVAESAPGRELRCRVAGAATLLAGLELTRDGALTLDQDGSWQPIHIRPRKSL